MLFNLKQLALFIAILSCMLHYSCANSSDGTSNTASKSTTAKTKAIQTVFRNMHFGMNAAQVSKTEVAKVHEKSAAKLVFSEDLRNGGFADITYTFDKADRLKKIEYDAYFGDAASANKSYKTIANGLNANCKKLSKFWDCFDEKNTYTVFLKEVKSSKAFGVNAVFERD